MKYLVLLPACGFVGKNGGVQWYWILIVFSLLHQGLQPPQHPSSHTTLKALKLTLTQYLATTPMPTTWTLQVSVVLLYTLLFLLPLKASRPNVLCCHLRVWDSKFIGSCQGYRQSKYWTLSCLCLCGICGGYPKLSSQYENVFP